MIEVGKKQRLTVIRRKDFGIYLGIPGEEETVLLPRRQVPEGLEAGGELEVFIYRDSQDRKIATVNEPRLTAGQIGVLTVVSVGGIGAFLDCGLERDVLLPFKEQTTQVEAGKAYPVYMYVDKSGRLCVTMRLYRHLDSCPPYAKDDPFRGIVYEYQPGMGAFVVMEEAYSGLIPESEIYRRIAVGEEVEGRVLRIREDGKADLSIRQPAYLQMRTDSERLWARLKQDGRLPVTDKAAPETIRREFGMSKNEFKRAVGRLLKEGRIEITGQEIRKK